MSKLIEQANLSYNATNDNCNVTDECMFTTTEGEFTFDFIEELHMIVGVDAVTEFYKALMTYEPERVEEFRKALKEYYELKRIMD